MIPKSILLVFLLFVTQSVVAQIMFQSHYGGTADDGGSSVLQTNDGGYLVVGSTYSYGAGGRDIYLIKTDENGDTIWTKTYGGIGDDDGYNIQQTNDNGFVISGNTQSYGAGSYDMYLIKTDGNGDILWTKTFGGSIEDGGYYGMECNDGGFAIAGYTMSYSNVFSSAYLVRTDINGDTLWTKCYEKLYSNVVSEFKETSDGGFIIVSNSQGFYSTDLKKIWLIKTNNLGDTLWTKLFSIPNCDLIGWSIELTNDNGYIIAGVLEDSIGEVDVYIFKTDSIGNLLWSKRYNGTKEERAFCIKQTNDNGFIVSGVKGSFSKNKSDFFSDATSIYYYKDYYYQNQLEKWSNGDVYLMKLNSVGDTIWTREFGGNDNDFGGKVTQTSDNGYIVTGYTNSFSSNFDVYVVKTDANGISDIPNNELFDDFVLYPNPSNGTFYIEYSNAPNTFEYCELLNTQGQKVYSQQINTDIIEINFNHSGVYLIRLIGNTIIIIKKIIIY